MTVYWVDYINGDDANAGTDPALPKKTITSASTGRTGGDEVRVAKSPSLIALTGTVGFTNNGTGVTGVGTLFTSELVIGDFILAPDGQYYEVVTLTSATAAVLYQKYPGSTQDGFSSSKLGVTSTGAAAASTTAIQTVSSSGTSDASRLKISGGWDLASQTQTGQTYFRQMHSTFANRYGYGLYFSAKSFTEISRLHFLRYYNGIYYLYGYNNVCIAPTCNSNGGYGVYYNGSNNSTLTSPTCNSNYHGIYHKTVKISTLTSPTCNSNSYHGIYYEGSNNNVCIAPTCNSNGDYGVYYNGSNNNNVFGILTTTGNSTAAICNDTGLNYIHKASISEATKCAGFTDYANSRVFINNMGGYSYIYTDNGNIVSQDATAGGTGKEWKLSPTNAKRNSVYPLDLSIAKIAVASGAQVTVTCYFKKSHASSIAGALRCRYGQIAWSEAAEDIISNCPDDTNRNQVTLQFTPTEAGVVEIEALAWYVSAADQSVIIDDIAVAQA